MSKELDYFTIEGAYGGNQDWFSDFMMRIGGCAAVTACDCCIYFARRFGLTAAYPYDADALTKADYIRFSALMKPYLHPRWSGIDRLQIYLDGFGAYLSEHGCGALRLHPLDGHESAERAGQALCERLDADFPVPCLTLNHADDAFEDYEWHWFLLTGYEMREGTLYAKAVTYGEARWLPFYALWNTGHRRRGGLILFSLGECYSSTI